MKPWYKGFQGTIVNKEAKSYLVSGKWEWRDKTLVITELPIKKWTKDYKEYLEKLSGIEVQVKETKEKEKEKKKRKEKKK